MLRFQNETSFNSNQIQLLNNTLPDSLTNLHNIRDKNERIYICNAVEPPSKGQLWDQVICPLELSLFGETTWFFLKYVNFSFMY